MVTWNIQQKTSLLWSCLLLTQLFCTLTLAEVFINEHICIHAHEKVQKHFRAKVHIAEQLYTTNYEETIEKISGLYEINEQQKNVKNRFSMSSHEEEHLIRVNVGHQEEVLNEKRNNNSDKGQKNTTNIWKPIRIVVDTSHLVNPKKICTTVGEARPDFLGSVHICRAEDIMTVEKLRFIKTIALPLALFRTQRFLNTNSTQRFLVVNKNACGRDVEIPLSHTTTGVKDADIVLYAHAGGINLSPMAGVARTVAWAGYCTVDQVGRPIVGQLNIVPSFIQRYGSSWEYEVYTRILTHEIFHALGFTSLLLEKMVNTSKRRGKSVNIVTESEVVSKARSYLNCATLDGVELEDEGETGVAETHWERRQWMDDIMAGAPTRAAVSSLTLAFFDSLPYYKANMQYSEKMLWGRNAGCGFVEKICTAKEGGMGIEFCDIPNTIQTCTFDRTSIGVCNVGTVGKIPRYFQYFNDPLRGGLTQLMDYCPVVLPYSNRHCLDSTQAGSDDVTYGHYFGPQGRCVPTTNMVLVGFSITDSSPRCLRVRCPLGKRVEVLVGKSWLSCPADGSAGDVIIPASSGYYGKLNCERADVLCSPELFYNPVKLSTNTGPLREFVLDVLLILNAKEGDMQSNTVDDLGRRAAEDGGYFYILLQEQISKLCSCDLGAGKVRMLPEYVTAAIDGGVALYVQLGLMGGSGGINVEKMRNTIKTGFAVGKSMTHLGENITKSLGKETTVIVTTSEIPPVTNIVDGLSLLTRLVTLGEITFRCGGDFSRILRKSNDNIMPLLQSAAREDISYLLYITLNMVRVKEITIVDSTEILVNARVSFPSLVKGVGDSENLLKYWSQLLDKSIQMKSPLPVLSSTVRVLSGGVPISLTEDASVGALWLKSTNVHKPGIEPNPNDDPRCLVQFPGCLIAHIVVYVLMALAGLTLIALIISSCWCKERKERMNSGCWALSVPLQPQVNPVRIKHKSYPSKS